MYKLHYRFNTNYDYGFYNSYICQTICRQTFILLNTNFLYRLLDDDLRDFKQKINVFISQDLKIQKLFNAANTTNGMLQMPE